MAIDKDKVKEILDSSSTVNVVRNIQTGSTSTAPPKSSKSKSSSGGGGVGKAPSVPEVIEEEKRVSEPSKNVHGEFSIRVEYYDRYGNKKYIGTKASRFDWVQQSIRDKGGYVSTVWRGSKVIAGGSGSVGLIDPKIEKERFYKQVEVTSDIESLGLADRYRDLLFQVYKGKITSDKASVLFEKEYEKAQTVEWMQEHGVFDGKSWKELKKEEPALYLRKTDKGFETYLDVVKWEEERHSKTKLPKKPDYNIWSWEYQLNLGGDEYTKAKKNLELKEWGRQFSYAGMDMGTFISHLEASLKGDTEKQKQITAQNYYDYERLWSKGDYLGGVSKVASNPFVMLAGSYILGAGIGALKTTALGSKTVIQSRGVWETTRYIPGTSKAITTAGAPIYSITLGGATELGITGYFTYQSGKGLTQAYAKDELPNALKVLAFSFPIAVTGYKAGYTAGMGWMQRTKAMSTLKGNQRTQQEGFYQILDTINRLDEPRFPDRAPYDLTSAKHVGIDTASEVAFYLRNQRYKFWSENPRMGGSLGTKMLLGEQFRTGAIPQKLSDYALSRQALSNAPTRALIGKQGAVDIDLLITRDTITGASLLYKPHVVDVSISKPGEYHWGGMTTFKPVKNIKIVDPYLSNLKIKVRPEYQMMDSLGLAKPGKGEIYLSSAIIGKTSKEGWVWGIKKEPGLGTVYAGRLPGRNFSFVFETLNIKIKGETYYGGIPKTTTGLSVFRHELKHHTSSPKFSSRNSVYRHFHEVKTELMEFPAFNTGLENQAIRTWFKTGKWEYPTQTLNIKTMSLKDQFMRKTVSSMPSMKSKFYRSYKDVPDFSDLYDFFYLSTGSKRLEIGMDKILNPAKYSTPRVSFGEKVVSKIDVIQPKLETSILDTPLYSSGSYSYPSSPSSLKIKYSVGASLGSFASYGKSSYQPSNRLLTVPATSYPSRTSSSKYPSGITFPFKITTTNKTSTQKGKIKIPYVTPTYNKYPPANYTYKLPPPKITPPGYTPPPPEKYIITTTSKTKKRFFAEDVSKKITKQYKKSFNIEYRYRQFKIPDINKITKEIKI